jgi:hypothetical protein
MVPEPSSVGDALAYLTAFTPSHFDRIRQRIPADWIEEALLSTGTATIRRRRLPADQVVWLVIGMGLMRDQPLPEMVDRLGLVLPSAKNDVIASSAVSQARARLGHEPLDWLFVRTANAWAQKSAASHAWRGLKVYGVDGSTMRVPNTDENRRYFGSQSGRNESDSGYPLLRVVVLMVLRTHVLAGASFGPYTGELGYAADLWPQLPQDSLVIVDRAYLAAPILIAIERDRTNRHWLTRATKRTKWTTIERLGRGDEIVEMEVSREARKQDPSLGKTWRARAIRYQHRGFEPQTLLTSLVDAERYPRDEIVALYHERWELELGYDELKTEMLAREEAIRSKSPQMVQQEILGLLLAYNLIRLEMERIAKEAGVAPTRISFVATLRLVCDAFDWFGMTRTPGAIPARLAKIRTRLKRFVLPERRSRSYPRAVKIKMSNYPRKRPPSDRSLK